MSQCVPGKGDKLAVRFIDLHKDVHQIRIVRAFVNPPPCYLEEIRIVDLAEDVSLCPMLQGIHLLCFPVGVDRPGNALGLGKQQIIHLVLEGGADIEIEGKVENR